MFKRIETAWNSRTPEYLHPRTKANLIWQLKMMVVVIAGMTAWDKYQERQLHKKYRNTEIHIAR